MVKLIWVNFKTFIVISKKNAEPKAYRATTEKSLNEILRRLGVVKNQSDYAMYEMRTKKDNVCQFGVVNGSFIFSEYDSKYDKRRVDVH
jgi:hypothetical protein